MKNVKWSCSWRYAGTMVAEIREDSDFNDWYCSGIQLTNQLFVPESIIVPEIETDFDQLGWIKV